MQDQMRALVPVPPRTPTSLLLTVVSGLPLGTSVTASGGQDKKKVKTEFHHLHEPGEHLI